MFENKTVAVVVPCYNEQLLINRVIDTVPTFVDRIIVIDDCSTDRSLDALMPFKDQIKVVSTESNGGVAVASNVGVRESKGQFFIRVDADDYVNSCR